MIVKYQNFHIDSISHKRKDERNISLSYFNSPIQIKTDIVVFQSGIYSDMRKKYHVGVKISPDLHHFLLMLDARLEKYAKKCGLKYLRLVKKDEYVIELKVPFRNNKCMASITKENERASTDVVTFGEGAELVLNLSNLWIMNNDIAGPLITVSQIDMAFNTRA